jgi:hypothetical protein
MRPYNIVHKSVLQPRKQVAALQPEEVLPFRALYPWNDISLQIFFFFFFFFFHFKIVLEDVLPLGHCAPTMLSAYTV